MYLKKWEFITNSFEFQQFAQDDTIFHPKAKDWYINKDKSKLQGKKNVEKSGKCQMKNKLCWKITGAAGGSGNKKCANTAEGGGLGNQLKDN